MLAWYSHWLGLPSRTQTWQWEFPPKTSKNLFLFSSLPGEKNTSINEAIIINHSFIFPHFPWMTPAAPQFWSKIPSRNLPGNVREFQAISAQLTAPSMHTMDGKHYAPRSAKGTWADPPGPVVDDVLGKTYIYRRKFRSQTSDNMQRWKSRGGKSQDGEVKKWEGKRWRKSEERRCRCAKR